MFVDARHIFRQIDRAHREFTPEQVEFLANISVGYRVKSTVATRFLNRSDPRKTPRGPHANGALAHQPRATPWERVHPHLHKP